MKSSALLIASLATTNAHVGFGKCPTPSLINNMNTDAFQGNWYEVQRDAFFPFEQGTECVTMEATTRENDGNIRLNTAFWSAPMAFQYMSAMGTMSDCGADPSVATCQFQMDDIPEAKGAFSFIEFDAGSHFVQYYCSEMVGEAMYMDFVWIMGRNQDLAADESALASIHESIKAKLPDYDLSWAAMHNTRHYDCKSPWIW